MHFKEQANSRWHQSGLTLLEVLGVVGILALLVVLALGPISKAKRRADFKIYQAAFQRVYPSVREDLQRFYRAQTNFPAWTARELHEKGVFDRQVIHWMEAGWVVYHPFSSASPDNHSVIQFYSHTEPNGVTVWNGLSKSNVLYSPMD